MPEKNGAPISFYHKLSTETLNNMLRDMTLSPEELDLGQLDLILRELRTREDAATTMDPEEALGVFQKYYAGTESGYLDCAPKEARSQLPPQKKRKKKSLRTLFLVATVAVLVFGFILVAQAGGMELFGPVASWTPSRFSFQDIYDTPEEQPFVWPQGEMPDSSQFSSLQEALDAYGFQGELHEPTRLPEGYTMQDLSINYIPDLPYVSFLVGYQTQTGSRITVSFTSLQDDRKNAYEKTADPVESYSIVDTTYYAFSNTDVEDVVWLTEHFECCVYGTEPRDTIIEIATSCR